MPIRLITNSMSLTDTVSEHNILNGFVFVIVEFSLVMLGALFIGWAGILHGEIIIMITGIGIAVNALTICIVAMGQRKRHENDEGIMRFWSAETRRRIGAEHPGLGKRTLAIVIATAIPFLLSILVSRKL